MSVNLLTEAVNANLRAATTEVLAQEARLDADGAFIFSARSFAAAIDDKHTYRDIAAAVKEAAKNAPQAAQSLLYTSVGSVGFHARTGRISLLEGDLPASLTWQAVQTLVKQASASDVLGAKGVDKVIADAEEIRHAVKALQDAIKNAAQQPPADGAGEDNEQEGEGSSDEAAEPTAVDLLTSAASIIAKAVALVIDGDVSPEVAALVTALREELATVEGALSLAVVAA